MSTGPLPSEQPPRGSGRGPNADLLAPFLPDPPAYRASDTDREQVTRLLSQAMSAGQLGVHEFDERTKAVYAAKTHTDLAAVTRDLVVRREAWRFADDPGSGPSRLNLFGVMGGFRRKGEWVVPPRVNAFVFWGGGILDLRDAVFSAAETQIRVWAVMGGAKIIVPRELGLHVRGVGVMAGFDDRASGSSEPGRPKIEVKGFSFWGGVSVVREYVRRKPSLRKRLKAR